MVSTIAKFRLASRPSALFGPLFYGYGCCLLSFSCLPPGAHNAEVERAMAMSAQEIICDLRAGGERADVTLSKVRARLLLMT